MIRTPKSDGEMEINSSSLHSRWTNTKRRTREPPNGGAVAAEVSSFLPLAVAPATRYRIPCSPLSQLPQLSLEFPKMFEVRPSFSARKTHRGELNSGQVEVWELLPLEAYSYYVFLPIMVYKGWPARPRKGKCHVGWYLMSDWRPVTKQPPPP